MPDPYDLERFVQAQERDQTYASALSQLRAGRKTSHWMWFVFPQVAGLGRSPTAQHYAIASLDEARAYLDHPVLGPRLLQSAEILTGLRGLSAQAIFGDLDAVKLRSSMTLFARAAAATNVFERVIDQYFGGQGDEQTGRLLAGR